MDVDNYIFNKTGPQNRKIKIEDSFYKIKILYTNIHMYVIFIFFDDDTRKTLIFYMFKLSIRTINVSVLFGWPPLHQLLSYRSPKGLCRP